MSLVESYHVARKARLARLSPQPVKAVVAKPYPSIPRPNIPPQDFDAGWEGMWFADLVRGRGPRATVPIKEIQEAVAKFYGVSVLDLVSGRRTKDINLPRQVAMYLCRTLTLLSYNQIGRYFGGRDHTTIIHGSEKIEYLLGREMRLMSDVNTLRGVLA